MFAWMYRDLPDSQMRMIFLCNRLILIFRHYVFKDLFLRQRIFVLIVARKPESWRVIIGVVSDRNSVGSKFCVLVQELRLLRTILLLVRHNEAFFWFFLAHFLQKRLDTMFASRCRWKELFMRQGQTFRLEILAYCGFPFPTALAELVSCFYELFWGQIPGFLKVFSLYLN